MWYIAFVIVIGCCFAAIQAELVQRPQNVAAVAGDSITLNCGSSDDTELILWTEFISSDTGQNIFIGSTPSSPPNAEIYSIDNPSAGVYNLGISLLDFSGGRYKCQQLSPQHDANLNVIVLGK